MRDCTFTIRLSGRWLTVALAVLLVGAVLVPAVASAAGSFNDDNGSTHEGNIEWLASAGITVGCNPPANDNYCPGDPVTRAQMATFMRRFAQFLGAEDGTVNMADYAVNSDRLDGKDVTQVRPSVAWWSNDQLYGLGPDFSVSRTVTVPEGGGTITMVGSFDFHNPDTTWSRMAQCVFSLDGNQLDDSYRFATAEVFQYSVCATNAARDVGAGTHTITFQNIGTAISPHHGTFHVIVIPHN